MQPQGSKRKDSLFAGSVQFREADSEWKRAWLVFDKSSALLHFYTTSKEKSAFLQLSAEHATFEDETEDEGTEKKRKQYCFSIHIFGQTFMIGVAKQEEHSNWLTMLTTFQEEKIIRNQSWDSSSDDSETEPSDKDTEDIIISDAKDSELSSIVELPIPDNKTNTVFDMLPDEAMVKIWSFLDAPTLGKAAQVCKRFKRISYDVPVWRDMARKRRWDIHKPGGLAAPKDPTRSFYVKNFLSFRRREQQLEDQRLQNYKSRLKQRAKENSGKFLLLCCFGRPYEWFAALSLVWITILSALKLDGVVDWAWSLIFIPFYFVILQIIFAPVVYDIISTKHDYSFEEELDPDDNQLYGPIFFFLAFVLPMSDSKEAGRMGLYPLIGGVSVFLILSMIRIGGVSELPWWVVFIPLNIACIWVILIIMFAGYDTIGGDDQRFDRIVPCVGMVILMLFFVLLSIKLDGVIDWSWYMVFIPLFVLKGMMVLLPLILSVLTVYFEHKGSYWLEDRSRWPDHLASYCMTAVLVAVLVLGPLLTFEILLAKKLEEPDDPTTYSLIFIPLFILEGFGLCGCCIVNCAFLCS